MDNFQQENSYSTILKRVSSFGGVQILNVVVNLVRGKFVAMFLGPAGMGISSMFTSSAMTVQQFAGLGLNLSIVREIASGKSDGERLPVIISVAKRLILLTSLLGAVACVLLAPLLSLWSFGSYDYTSGYIFLSAFVLLSIAGAGYLSLLQGMSEIKRLSKASLVGSCTGLICGVPLYYFFGTGGIVPAMIILALAMFMFYYFSWRKAVDHKEVQFRWSEHKELVGKLLSLGFILMLSNLMVTLTGYLINIYVSKVGSVHDVGLFQSANSLTNQYVGIIFSALALDYFPRLSAVVSDPEKMKEVINRQIEIVTLIITPLVLILLLTAPIVVEILLTSEFMVIVPLVKWLGLGMMVQSALFPLDYVFLAKGNRKVYVWVEVASNVLWIMCSIGFYYLYSLNGLGVSLVVRGLINHAVSYNVCRRLYSFGYTVKVKITMAMCYFIGVIGFLLSFSSGDYVSKGVLAAIAIASALFSFLKLRKAISDSNG